MNIKYPRKDFVIVEDYFSPQQAAEWLGQILKRGEDELRGFHHPHLKPNRFHKNPKYPVKKYMCWGLYWNPLDYQYYPVIPEFNVKPFPLKENLREVAGKVLNDFFPVRSFSPEAVIINYYTKDSKMGLHVDKDEDDKTSPVIGLNFGSTVRFYFADENDVIKDILIPGNSLYIFGGTARQMRHGIGLIYTKTLSPGSEGYLSDKERVNLTIRQVFKTPEEI